MPQIALKVGGPFFMQGGQVNHCKLVRGDHIKWGTKYFMTGLPGCARLGIMSMALKGSQKVV